MIGTLELKVEGKRQWLTTREDIERLVFNYIELDEVNTPKEVEIELYEIINEEIWEEIQDNEDGIKVCKVEITPEDEEAWLREGAYYCTVKLIYEVVQGEYNTRVDRYRIGIKTQRGKEYKKPDKRDDLYNFAE